MIKIVAATLTDPGILRDINEDRVWAQIFSPSEGDSLGMFIVCDGVGGNLGGEVASHWAVESIRREMDDLFCPRDPRATVRLSESALDTLDENVTVNQHSLVNGADEENQSSEIKEYVTRAIQKANQVVYEYAQHKPFEAGDAGTTVSMAVVKGRHAVIANVGDSRTYLLHAGQLRQITHDHSLVASLVNNGIIQPGDIFTHPQRNVIYRSLGQKVQVQVDIFEEDLQPGDFLLVCSDGLWEMVKKEQAMAEMILSSENLDKACQRLGKAALAAGGEDNIGIVLAKIL